MEFVGKHNTSDDRETEMIDVRWNIFEFTHRIPQADQQGNFWRTVKDKHRKPKLIKTELWEENKTDPIQQNKK